MKKSTLAITIVFLVTCFISNSSYAYRIERADRMNLTVKVDISFNSETKEYEYNYTIISHEESLQELEKIIIEYEGELSRVNYPRSWRVLFGRNTREREGATYFFEALSPNGRHKLTWWTYPESRLKPNSSKSGFTMKSKGGAPGIVTFYARGFVLDSDVTPGAFEDYPDNPELASIYVNSLQGKTLGPILEPILPPAVLDPVLFTDFIVGYTDEALQLGWINDTTVASSIKDKLTDARGNIDKDNQKALGLLQALLDDLESQHGKSINDEAYLLIKLNVLHLRDNIK